MGLSYDIMGFDLLGKTGSLRPGTPAKSPEKNHKNPRNKFKAKALYGCLHCNARIVKVSLDDGGYGWIQEGFPKQILEKREKFPPCGCGGEWQFFDSQREWKRFLVLRMLLRAGDIAELRLQVPFPIVVEGQHIAYYLADFVYFDRHHFCWWVVEDVKGADTDVSKLKRKLVEAIYGIDIKLT